MVPKLFPFWWLRVGFTCADVLACLEGSFSSWSIYDRFVDSDVSGGKGRQGALVNAARTQILLMDEYALKAKKYTIATKALAELDDSDHDWPRLFSVPFCVRAYSVLGTYAVSIVETEAGVRIYKDGEVVQKLTNVDLDIDATDVFSVDIGWSGKYIIISGDLTTESANGWVILVGA